MKKRILASTMASVMALSAASTMVVSSANVADFKVEAMTKSQLKKFLEDKEIVDLAENDGVEEYGSISGSNFMKAYDFAKNVSSNTDYNDDDATVAYQVLKAAKAALVKHNNVELAALVEDLRPIYNTDNILNSNNDAIYEETPWNKFLDAFESAESYVDSTDLRVTTDAYEELYANRNPKKKTQKTKKQIDAARAAYEKALQDEFKYQSWQRGTIEGSSVSNLNGKTFAWGALIQHAKNETTITAAYKKFDEIKGITVTTDDDIVNAVKDLEAATSVLTSFKPSSFETGSQSKVNTLLKKYYGQMVYTFKGDAAVTPILTDFIAKGKNTTTNKADIMLNDKWTTTASAAGDIWNLTMSANKKYKATDNVTGQIEKVLAAEVKVRNANATELYCVVTTKKLPTNEGEILSVDGTTWFYTSATAATDAIAGIATANSVAAADLTTRKITKGGTFVISDFIKVTSADMASDTTPAAAATAVTTAETGVTTAVSNVYKVTSGAADAGVLASVDNLISAVEAKTAAAKTAISNLDASVDDDSDPDTPDKNVATYRTAAVNKLDDVVNKIASIRADINAAKSNTTIGNMQALIATISGLDSAVAELVKATTTYDAQASNTAASAAITALKTALDAATETVLVTTTISTKVDDWSDALQSLADAQLAKRVAYASAGYSQYNNVMDLLLGGTSAASVAADDRNKAEGDLRTISGRFNYATPYSSSMDNPTCELTAVNLPQAMALIEDYNRSTTNDTHYGDIKNIDSNNTVVGDPKGSTIEWKLIYNFTKYALEDLFTAATDKEYGYTDVKKLLDDSYKLATDTVETSLFAASHMNLYNARNTASKWLTAKSATKPYTDKETIVKASDYANAAYNKTSTEAYNDLKKKYDTLNSELANFKYSYQDIIDTMAKIAKDIDAGKVGGDDIKKALYATADAFLKVEAVKDTSDTAMEDSEAFTEDGELKKNNRLITKDDKFKLLQIDSTEFEVDKSKDGYNQTHYDMRVAYDNLLKLYNDATTKPVSGAVQDVNGSGSFDINDVSALLKLFVDSKMDVTKHDFNKDNKVDINDVSELLKQFVNKTN